MYLIEGSSHCFFVMEQICLDFVCVFHFCVQVISQEFPSKISIQRNLSSGISSINDFFVMFSDSNPLWKKRRSKNALKSAREQENCPWNLQRIWYTLNHLFLGEVHRAQKLSITFEKSIGLHVNVDYFLCRFSRKSLTYQVCNNG